MERSITEDAETSIKNSYSEANRPELKELFAE
jgi:hypothetical protein